MKNYRIMTQNYLAFITLKKFCVQKVQEKIYKVSWSGMFISFKLDTNENWKFALTEINYIYKTHTVTTNLRIQCDRCSDIEFNFEEMRSVKTQKIKLHVSYIPDLLSKYNVIKIS